MYYVVKGLADRKHTEKNILTIRFIIFFLLITAQAQAQVRPRAIADLLEDSAIKEGHIGVSIYDISKKTYLYNYNAEKYFVPASNVKIFSLYAGLRYLGDSLLTATVEESDTAIFVYPNGDPTFLQEDFSKQAFFEYLKSCTKPIYIVTAAWQEQPQGKGWMWDDYHDEYSAERSLMPIYGNVLQVKGSYSTPAFFKDSICVRSKQLLQQNNIERDLHSNTFYNPELSSASLPFLTRNGETNIAILSDVLQKPVHAVENAPTVKNNSVQKFYSYPSDTLFRIMMHRSDNFFAEQTLLMAGNTAMGKMNDKEIINKILEQDLKNIPQEPQWVDGCGLSRYNLFTPQSFTFILDRMQEDFGIERLKYIFPSGGDGTITNYYQSLRGKIYAKTGTMSDISGFNGYLITKQNKMLAFSMMVNNYQKGGRAIRLAFQRFLLSVYETN